MKSLILAQDERWRQAEHREGEGQRESSNTFVGDRRKGA